MSEHSGFIANKTYRVRGRALCRLNACFALSLILTAACDDRDDAFVVMTLADPEDVGGGVTTLGVGSSADDLRAVEAARVSFPMDITVLGPEGPSSLWIVGMDGSDNSVCFARADVHFAASGKPRATVFLAPIARVDEPLYALTVIDGRGDGTFASGEEVWITARAPEPGALFAGWVGDTGGIAYPDLPGTFLRMPEDETRVRASYTPLETQEELRITALTLIDAQSDTELFLLVDASVVNLHKLPTDSLNIRADTFGAVRSVHFAWNDVADYHTENTAPFAIGGDIEGDYQERWTPALGVHTVTATPYAKKNAKGSRGDALAVTFTVVDAVNVAPVAHDDGPYVVSAGQRLTVAPDEGALVNDQDDDPEDVLEATLAAAPGHGKLSLSPNGGFTYVPDPGFQGDDAFAYTVDDGFGGGDDAQVTITVRPPINGRHPFGGLAWAVPGRIEAEGYDTGGEGVAYHDTTPAPADRWGLYRHDGVDIVACGEENERLCIGDTSAGEWAEYTIRVHEEGAYRVALRVALVQGHAFCHVQIDGTSVSDTIAVPTSTRPGLLSTVVLPPITLTDGDHVLRLGVDGGDFQWDYVELIDIIEGEGD